MSVVLRRFLALFGRAKSEGRGAHRGSLVVQFDASLAIVEWWLDSNGNKNNGSSLDISTELCWLILVQEKPLSVEGSFLGAVSCAGFS